MRSKIIHNTFLLAVLLTITSQCFAGALNNSIHYQSEAESADSPDPYPDYRKYPIGASMDDIPLVSMWMEADIKGKLKSEGPFPYVSSKNGLAMAYIERMSGYATMVIVLNDPHCKGASNPAGFGYHFIQVDEYKVAMRSICEGKDARKYWEPGGGEGQLVRIFIEFQKRPVHLQEIAPDKGFKPLSLTFPSIGFGKEFHYYVRRTMVVY